MPSRTSWVNSGGATKQAKINAIQARIDIDWEEKLKKPEYCYGNASDGNLLIHDDNLLDLKSLQKEYVGQKMYLH